VLIVLRGSQTRGRRSRRRHSRRDWQADWGYAPRFSLKRLPVGGFYAMAEATRESQEDAHCGSTLNSTKMLTKLTVTLSYLIECSVSVKLFCSMRNS